MKKQIVKVKLLDGYAQMPKYAHDGDLGMDVVATKIDFIPDEDVFLYHTGISMESNRNLGLFVMLRSSNKRTNFYLANGVGLVETFIYRGEICLAFKCRDSSLSIISRNATETWNDRTSWEKISTFFGFGKSYAEIYDEEYTRYYNNIYDLAPYNVGERIGQLVFLNFPEIELERVEELSKTVRGEGGFGSSGK